MLNAASDLPEDPALLKAIIAALQTENAKLTTTLRAHDRGRPGAPIADRQAEEAGLRQVLREDPARDRATRVRARRRASLRRGAGLRRQQPGRYE